MLSWASLNYSLAKDSSFSCWQWAGIVQPAVQPLVGWTHVCSLSNPGEHHAGREVPKNPTGGLLRGYSSGQFCGVQDLKVGVEGRRLLGLIWLLLK